MPETTVLVRATMLGYFGHARRYAISTPGKADHPKGPGGAPFEVPIEQFSEKWMEPLRPDGSPMSPEECVDLIAKVVPAYREHRKKMAVLTAAHNDKGFGSTTAASIVRAREIMKKKADEDAAAETERTIKQGVDDKGKTEGTPVGKTEEPELPRPPGAKPKARA